MTDAQRSCWLQVYLPNPRPPPRAPWPSACLRRLMNGLELRPAWILSSSQVAGQPIPKNPKKAEVATKHTYRSHTVTGEHGAHLLRVVSGTRASLTETEAGDPEKGGHHRPASGWLPARASEGL